MSTASQQTIQALEQVVKTLPVGTNLALLQLMWAMLNGSFLKSRGAVHGALAESGFTEEQIRRSWQALRYGVWSIRELIMHWRHLVLTAGRWQVHEYEGYQPLAVDITAFWRPRLQGWMGKFFHRLANRAVKAVGFGIITQVGEVDGQRLPLLKRIIRVKTNETSEAELKADILRQVPYDLAEREVFVHDGGVLRLWNVQTWELEHLIEADDQDLLEPRGVLTLNIIEDGTLLLSGGADNTARVWRVETGQLLVELGPHLSGVLAAVFSPDGAKMATATTNGIVRLWDTQSGNLIDTMRGHATEVLTIDFNADGTLLVTTSNDGTARLWPIFPGTIRQMLTEAARRANRPFTEAECEQYFADTLAVCLGGSP